MPWAVCSLTSSFHSKQSVLFAFPGVDLAFLSVPFPTQPQPIRPCVDCRLCKIPLARGHLSASWPPRARTTLAAHRACCGSELLCSCLHSPLPLILERKSESPIAHCPQLPSRGTLLSYLVADLELEDKSPSWGDPPLGIEKLPDALLFLPQTAIKHQLKQGVRRHFGFSMFLLYSVKMYASWEELM